MKRSAALMRLTAQAALMAQTDTRILSMPAELILIWLRLVQAIIDLGTDGVLDTRGNGAHGLGALARFRFHCDETQIETYLETYAQNLVITYDAETGRIALPAALMPSRRALASRMNGAKGGRPRKNGGFGPQDDPRQRAAMLPIQGGKSMAEQKPGKTYGENQVSLAKLAKDNSYEAKAKPRAEEIDAAYAAIGPKAFEAAGYDPARDMGHWGIVRQWCALGLTEGLSADEIERLVVAVVSRVAGRQRDKGRPAASLGYFARAVEQAIAERDIPEKPKTAEEYRATKRWEQACQDHMHRIACGEASTLPVLAEFIRAEQEAA